MMMEESTTTSNQTHIHDLPTEVIELTFSFLGTIPLMRSVYPSCRRFHEIINESVVNWMSLELFPFTDGYQDDDNFKLVDFENPIKKRNISSSGLIKLFDLLVPKFGSKFRDLSLTFSSLFTCSPPVFEMISTHCTNIKSLKIEAPSSGRPAMAANLLKVLEASSSNIQELIVHGGFPHSDFPAISKVIGKTLKSLYIEEKEETEGHSTHCPQDRDASYQYVELEHLYLGGVKVDKAFLESYFKNSSKLKSIVFDQCHLNIEAIIDFLTTSEVVNNVQHLEFLCCSLNTKVIPTMNMWGRIFDKCPNLVNLFIHCSSPSDNTQEYDLCFGDAEITACVDKCKKLEVLDIRNSSMSGKFFKDLQKAKKLETLIMESKNWNMSNILTEHGSPIYSHSIKNLCMYGDKCDNSLEKPISTLFPTVEFVHFDKFA
ncbi:predicted protein [Naegleria gruberi]|uniref:Predicted protein n=1 Tax=Naegleria gruberi TaxID=5762 RepID=D2UZ57_NAEGR|nr:uncharacterized protein NAEGRDRAFT_45399 [Naegleria gruberi]EFC49884.1 predicted protein [Naegleria gruberi]|eukprot:XP_002682628.1 predicted protein [Naegleria gruberi strain NEG-M]